MDTSENENRRARRVTHHYILRARLVDFPENPGAWDISTVRNISETGILFHSAREYPVGSRLEIKLALPTVQEHCTFWGNVVRCLPAEGVKDIFEVAVNITDIEETSKEGFYENLKFFEKREKEKR